MERTVKWRGYDNDDPLHTLPMRAPDLADDPASPDETWDRPSKTQRKKASHELQDLGEALVALPDDRLDALPIPETLRDAVREHRRTRTHEGRRRQMQYIGKLMRGADVGPIRQAVTDVQLGRAKDALALHEAERWRTELIASDDHVTRFMQDHAQADVQHLRNLIRNARKDAALVPEKRSGRAYRELFQFIRAAASSAASTDTADE
jgi:ribosome-associated protein